MTATTTQRPSYLDWSNSGRSSGWRYLSGALLILIIWFIGQALLVIVGALALGAEITPAGEIRGIPQWWVLLISVGSFIPFFIATPLIVRFILDRPALTVVTPFRRISPRLMLWGGALWLVAVILPSIPVLITRSADLTWNYQPGVFWPALGVAIVLLIFQTTAEELFFRGYLLQWFGKKFTGAWFLGVASGVLFALPHLANPEVAEADGWGWLLAFAAYFPIGFALAVVSVRSGTLELAIGAHFANNFLNVVVVSVSNSALGTTALWIDTAPSMLESAIGAAVSAALFIGLCWKLRGSGEPRPLQPRWVRPAPVIAPPGWFRDPLGAAALRYWDGASWTHYTHPPQAAQPAQAAEPVQAGGGAQASQYTQDSQSGPVAWEASPTDPTPPGLPGPTEPPNATDPG
ncbi:MAG: CPBP family glutamic-type intramembrane protease [Candidatus Nanopelagicales bacterium]